jgi:uncharacterized protein YgiM (DUF1202 family)
MNKAVTNSELSLRKEPRASTKILDVIPSGTTVTVLSTVELKQTTSEKESADSKKWSQVYYGENKGWVPTSALTIEKTLSEKIEVSEIETEDQLDTDNDNQVIDQPIGKPVTKSRKKKQ